jgi:hypothetical protein
LVSDGEDDLGEQSADLDFNDLSDELVASADLTEPVAGFFRFWRGLEERSKCAAWDEVMASGGLDTGELAGEKPLLDGRVAEPELCGGFAGFEERVG